MESMNGFNIMRAYKFVADCGNEVAALMKLLEDAVTEALAAQGNGLPCVPAAEPSSETILDEGGSVYTGWLLSIPLKRKGKGSKRIEKHLSFQVSMLGDGCDIPGNNEPLLHVYCWESEPDLDEHCMTFPLDADEEMHVIADRLIVWGEQEGLQWDDQGWAYTLKLVQLNNPADLHDHVIRPMMKLLQGVSVMQALPDSLPGLLHYPNVEALVAED